LSGLVASGAEAPASGAAEAAAAIPAAAPAQPAPAPSEVIPAVIPAVTPAAPELLDPSLPAPGTPGAVDPAAAPDPAGYADLETPITMDGTPDEGGGWVADLPEEAVGFDVQPSGFSGTAMAMDKINRLLQPVREGFSVSASVSGTYDSNPTQGYGAGNNDDGDFFATLGGALIYQSRASELTFGASYSGSYSAYADQTDLSGYNQSARAWSDYQGGPFSANLSVGFGINDAANRYYGAVVKETSVNYGLSGRYKLSERTVISGNVGQNFTMADGNFTDTSSLSTGLNVLWRYSERTEFGPGVRYTTDSGASDNFRTSFGPTITCNYTVTGKITLTSQLGMDFVDYDGPGGDDTMLSAMIGLNYRASELWGMSLSFYRDGQADPTLQNGTMEVNNISLSYYHKLLSGVWTVGATYETNGSGTVADPNGASQDSDYFGIFTGFSMPVFRETCNFSSYLNWSENSGGKTGGSGSFQATVGLSRSF
jgi:hypothetical protein